MFCDWLTIRQVHHKRLAEVHDGKVYNVDVLGNVENVTLKRLSHEGSYSTNITVRCDGSTVEVSGNVGRYNRPDNVFGHSAMRCVEIASDIARSLGLPPFTVGISMIVTGKDGKPKQVWTGARISRVDMTENMLTGGPHNTALVMNHYSTQKIMRLKQRSYGNDETIVFGAGDTAGSGSKYLYAKLYVKHIEMRKHLSKLKRKMPELDETYLNNLITWCESEGLIRYEIEFKSNFLNRHGVAYLGDVTDDKLQVLFNQYYEKLLLRVDADMTDDELPQYARGTLARWKAGETPGVFLKQATFYRHRAECLKAGYDIAEPFSNVVKFPTKYRVVNITSAAPPLFYQMA